MEIIFDMDYDPRDYERGKKYDGDLVISFESKAPHDTWWLMICHNEGKPPQELIDDLIAAGWEFDGTFGMRPTNGREEALITRGGTGIFGGWAGNERGKFMADALTVLENHGIVDVPLISLTLQDLL